MDTWMNSKILLVLCSLLWAVPSSISSASSRHLNHHEYDSSITCWWFSTEKKRRWG